MTIFGVNNNWFRLHFDDHDFVARDAAMFLFKMKQVIPTKTRRYFPEKKEWWIHRSKLREFMMLLLEFEVGNAFIDKLIFKQEQLI